MGYWNKLAVIFFLFIFTAAPATQAAQFIVNTTDDPTPDPTADPCAVNDCSLREAVIASNANTQDDTIVLEATSYPLTRQGSDENAAATGDLDITDTSHTLTISGVSAATTIIDATDLGDRILDVAGIPTITLNLINLTLQNGDAGSAQGGAIAFGVNGGFGTILNITDSRLIGNKASNGGAIRGCCNAPNGSVNLLRTVVFNNSASSDDPFLGNGGGLYVNNTIGLNIRESTIDMNHADSNGGGIFTGSSGIAALLLNSTVSNNDAGSSGGGLFYQSGNPAVNANNSTFSGNQAATGGAISMSGLTAFKLRNVTITDNESSGQGAGIYIPGGLNEVDIANSILAGNTSLSNIPSQDCFVDTGVGADITSLGYNIFGDVSSCALSGTGDSFDIDDPVLGPLADNGGPTLTHLPALDSPAIDHGDPAGCKDTAGVDFTQDQRGQPRPLGLCDSGSVEAASASSEIAVAPLSIDFGDISLEVPNTQNLAITNNDAGTLNVTGMSLSDTTNYAVAGGSCGGTSFSLTEGESCTAEVTFQPQAEGSFDATLTIASNDPLNPSVLVTLTGVGIDTGDNGGQVPPPTPEPTEPPDGQTPPPASGGCSLHR